MKNILVFKFFGSYRCPLEYSLRIIKVNNFLWNFQTLKNLQSFLTLNNSQIIFKFLLTHSKLFIKILERFLKLLSFSDYSKLVKTTQTLQVLQNIFQTLQISKKLSILLKTFKSTLNLSDPLSREVFTT